MASYEEFRREYWRHIQICPNCGLDFTVTKEPCFHGEPRFYAFDVLRHGTEDQRYLPLVDRKQRLRSILPLRGRRLLYVDHIQEHGEVLFEFACNKDMEGIVAKRKSDPYLPERESWFKIRNQQYSQWAGRQKFFEREREIHPDLYGWEGCTQAVSVLT